MKNKFSIPLLLVILGSFLYAGISIQKEDKAHQKEREYVRVSRVIDGDTIELSDGRRVRYVGIDAPEIGSEGKRGECFSQEAFEKNREMVEGKEVYLERDVSERDKYGRWLYLVFLKDVSVEEVLVKGGYARKMILKPDISYSSKIGEWEREAREKNIGIWGCNK